MIWMGAASAPSCGFGGIRGRQQSAIPPAARDGSVTALHGERRMRGPDLACNTSVIYVRESMGPGGFGAKAPSSHLSPKLPHTQAKGSACEIDENLLVGERVWGGSVPKSSSLRRDFVTETPPYTRRRGMC